MCPISATVQLLIVIFLFILTCHAAIVRTAKIKFSPENVTVHMYDTINVDITIEDGIINDYQIYTDNDNIAGVEEIFIKNTTSGSFNITGNFLGQAWISCKNKQTNKEAVGLLKVVVIRKQRVIDVVFHVSVAILVSIIYINFGCALNYNELLATIRRPIGPTIGFIGQFLVMPITSYVLGVLLFPESPEMQLGLFFTGVSPAGGASNVWTAVLDGNINLSITMTTISTFAAFAMMPFWIFTLGKTIFDGAKLVVPHQHILTYATCLVIPLVIGYLISRYMKKVAHFLARILKTFSSLLILFIVIFAIITNLYLFKLFSWKIVVAGMGLPFIGYLLGYLLAYVLKQPAPDRLAIAIETGIQNTGISIFLLRFALPQPQADLTTVAPVAVAIMTPLPLMLLFIYKKIVSRFERPKHEKFAVLEVPSGNKVEDRINA